MNTSYGQVIFLLDGGGAAQKQLQGVGYQADAQVSCGQQEQQLHKKQREAVYQHKTQYQGCQPGDILVCEEDDV